MADDSADDRLTGRNAVQSVGGHRANDVVYGHLGRLSYIPAGEGDEAHGPLHLNRELGPVPSFQQISAFAPWYAPTKTATTNLEPVTESTRLWRAAREQKQRLLSSNPEALMGHLGLGELFREDIAADPPSPSDPTDQALPLLAVGEILDVTDPNLVKGIPALASAVGEAHHALRIVALRPEPWQECSGPGGALELLTAAGTEEGFWCGDYAPIHQVKFARNHKRYEQTRWLLVQKSTSTVILEPKLGKMPALREPIPGYLPSGGLELISAHPIITFDLQDTAGNPHMDVSYNIASDSQVSQVAIIDRTGCWRIWDVAVHRHTGRIHRRELKRVGKIDSVPMPISGLGVGTEPGRPRIMWIGRPRNNSLNWTDHDGLSERSDDEAVLFDKLGLDASPPRLDTLLLSHRSGIQILDVAADAHGKPWAVLKLGKNERMLDVRRSPLHPAQIFVLTNVSLLWLEVRLARGKRARPSTILLSCRNLDHPGDESIRLALAPLTKRSRDMEACVVGIYSSKTLRATFYHLSVDGGEHAVVQKQTAYLPSLAPAGNVGLRTLLLLPTTHSRGLGEAAPTNEPKGSDADAPYYQMIASASDMALYSSLCAFSCERKEAAPVPEAARRQGGKSVAIQIDRRERKLARYYEKTFMMQGSVDEDESLRQQMPDRLRFAGSRASATRSVPAVIDLAPVCKHLAQLINQAAGLDDGSDRTAVDSTPFQRIHNVIAGHRSPEALPLKTWLELVGRIDAPFQIERVAGEWDNETRDLLTIDDDRVSTCGVALRSTNLALGELYESLFDLWTAGLRNDVANERFLARQTYIVGYIAARTFLSRLGLAILPQALLDASLPTRSASVGEDEPEGWATPTSFSQRRTAPPTPSETPSSFTAYTTRSRPASHETEGEEDAAVTRLRQYCPSIRSVRPREEGPMRLLANWEVGADPWESSWMPDESRHELEAALRQRRQADEARRRRRSEKIRQLRAGSHASEVVSRPGVRVIQSSQIREPQSSQALASSQSQDHSHGQDPFPSQTMSQPVIGSHGARPPLSARKKKKAKRMSGFR